MLAAEVKDARRAVSPGATESFSRLIRLSLSRLLPSRACFRFTGRKSLTRLRRDAGRNSKPAKRASRVGTRKRTSTISENLRQVS